MVSTSIREGPNNKQTESTIKDVEDFIEKMRNQDIVILYERARSISVDKDSPEPLSQALASSIANYEMLGKGAFLPEREDLANQCIGYINDAYIQGVIKENKEKLQSQVEELQKQINKISIDYEVLSSENNELRQEQAATNESISALTSTMKDLTEENKLLKKELDWYKQNSGSARDNSGSRDMTQGGKSGKVSHKYP
jgi:archaellum component FlaC